MKRMLAERIAREEREEAVRRAATNSANKRWQQLGALLIEQIDAASPFIDADCDPKKWRPSSLLKIMLCASSDNEEAERDAEDSVVAMLDLARSRFRTGLHPNPFLGEIA